MNMRIKNYTSRNLEMIKIEKKTLNLKNTCKKKS